MRFFKYRNILKLVSIKGIFLPPKPKQRHYCYEDIFFEHYDIPFYPLLLPHRRKYWLEIYYRYFRDWVDLKRIKRRWLRSKIKKRFLEWVHANGGREIKIDTAEMKEPILRYSDLNFKKFDSIDYLCGDKINEDSTH